MHGLPFILLMSDKQVTAAWRGLRVRSLSGDIRGRKAHKAASQNLKRRSGTTSFGLARGPPLLFEVLVRGETADDRP